MISENVRIEDMLHQAGYATERLGDVVIAMDPAQVSNGAGQSWIEWDRREIRTVADAVHFVIERE